MQNLHNEYYLCHGATVSKLPDEGLLFVLGPSKMHQSFVLAHRRWPVACAWTHVKCLLIRYSQNVNKSIPRLHCHFIGGAAQLVCSTCKLFHAPLFTLLVRWFIIEGWAWASIHCWFNVLSCTQTMDDSRICHCLLFHEHGKQKLHAAISPVKEATTLHTHLD